MCWWLEYNFECCWKRWWWDVEAAEADEVTADELDDGDEDDGDEEHEDVDGDGDEHVDDDEVACVFGGGAAGGGGSCDEHCWLYGRSEIMVSVE